MRRAIGILLGLLLITALGAGAPQAATPDAGLTPEELAAVQTQEQAVLAELFALNREREATQARLAELAAEQVSTGTKAAETEAKITETETALAALKERLAHRLRLLQERGKFNPIPILLGADKLSAFLDRLESVALLMNHDRRLMAEVGQTQQALTTQKAELESTQQRLAALSDEARATEVKLSAEITERETILASLQSERGRIEAELAKLEAAWAEVPALLANLAATISDSAARADGFEPDSVDFTLFPPGATAVVSDDSLNTLVTGDLAFAFLASGARLQGRITGAEFLLQGGFSIVDGRKIRFTPKEMALNGVVIPVEVVTKAVERSPIQIDLERWITPFHLLDLRLEEGALTVRSGL